MYDRERLARLARHVASTVEDGSLLGLGSGSTAEAVIRELGSRIAQGAHFTGVPTSKLTAEIATECGINLIEFDHVQSLELGIDGADEISPALDLIKGRGGALLHEKLVALTCRRFVIVAASEKLVEQLGTRLPLPVEVVQFGSDKTGRRLAELGLNPTMRKGDGSSPYVTDGGHFIFDCATGPIDAPMELASAIKQTAGVVEHGLFVGVATEAITVDHQGNIEHLKRNN